MTLEKFLPKLWAEIKALFQTLPVELQEAARIGVVITENIKTFVDSPAADIITALIPGNIDDQIKDGLRAKLPVILTDLRLITNTQGPTNADELTKAAVSIIQSMNGNVQSAFLHDLGILIAQEVAKAQNNSLSWSDGVYILEWYYQNRFKNR